MASSSDNSNWDNKKDKLLKDFSELLDSIDSIDLKEKLLWKQIYDNSISDRQSADLLFMDLYPYVKENSGHHATHGQHIIKYLERMEKSNEQLIKLAALIRKAVEDSSKQDDNISAADAFGRGNKK